MRPFQFITPHSAAEAREHLATHGAEAAVLAGGQTLLLQMKPRQVAPGFLVNIGRLAELRGWKYEGGQLLLGATTTYADLEDADPLNGAHDLLRSVASNLADRAARNLGTIGGALSAALSVYDVPAALLALDAELVLRSSTGERKLKVDEYIVGNGVTARGADELLEAIIISPQDGWRWSFQKYRRRLADPAIASVTVVASPSPDGAIADARVVIGAVTDVPSRLPEVEAALAGTNLDDSSITQIAALIGTEARARLGAAFKYKPDYAERLVSGLASKALAHVSQEWTKGV
ncbi:FAD binding domain-containing protein [Arthrobacter sp. Rue61a]|uniref:Quinaldine 4-oxidase medium subunit n=1 Tax=Paenarthrobacter ilicis TaxID=43665 RepID=Q7WSQ4_9MICC|nr:FAD binding domain-containing protein [Arthrobacter sp. Rue61a]AFR34514.1 quinaldine-4-oxidase, medium subunit MeqB [Arthrobacter sp. Rue61a]CAD61046.1 quinaldine 4-oxidase medium subunit [Paenarthrobacter ilicis]